MLLTQKSQIEAGRALTLYTLMQMDLAHAAETDQEREEADDLTAFLTPVVKAHLSDIGSEGANLAVQCFGGHGFVREWGVEQFVRDARICQIYEGTNGVQAMDLVGRKMNIHDGRLPRRFFNKVAQSLPKMEDGPAQEFIAPLRKALDRLQAALEDVAAMDMADRGAAAYPAMQAVGTLGLAWMWAEMAHAATNTNMAKIPTARFYFQQILPKLDYLCEMSEVAARSLKAPHGMLLMGPQNGECWGDASRSSQHAVHDLLWPPHKYRLFGGIWATQLSGMPPREHSMLEERPKKGRCKACILA
jgi:Acyl-CoA dehydrogenases